MPSSDPPGGHDAVLVYAGDLSRPELTCACIEFLTARLPSCVYAWGLTPEAVAELKLRLPPGSPDIVAGQERPFAASRVVVFGAAVAGEAQALLEDPVPAPGGVSRSSGVSAGPLAAGGLSAGPPPADGLRYALVPPDLDLRREAVLFELLRLHDLTGVLRVECPWDRRQTQRDIVSYTLEETYELVDAVRADSPRAEDIEGELGDLLFQVYFLAKVAEEGGAYDLGSVARGIHDKLVRRHPHIFGEVEAVTAEAVRRNWDEIKRTTEGRVGIFHEVPDSLPATLLAQKVQQRAAAVGFDWDDIAGPLAKIWEEMGELTEVLDSMGPAEETGPAVGGSPIAAVGPSTDGHPIPGAHPSPDTGPVAAAGPQEACGRLSARVTSEIGDVMFAVVNLARRLKVDPELALRESAGRFRSRVEGAAALAAAGGTDFSALDLDRQEAYYQQAKAELENA